MWGWDEHPLRMRMQLEQGPDKRLDPSQRRAYGGQFRIGHLGDAGGVNGFLEAWDWYLESRSHSDSDGLRAAI